MPDAIDPGRKPDAVIFATGYEPPRTRDRARDEGNRQHRLCLHFEAILGAPEGKTAYMRACAPDTWLVTLSPFDTLLYPEGHPRAKFPRYDWKTGDDGLRLGFLKPDEVA